MPKQTKSTTKKVTKAAPKPPLITQDTFIDRAIHYKIIRPEQRNEIKAWFDQNKLQKSSIENFQKLLDRY